ncbi:MAG: hypothetical protein GX992_04575 [Clostridium sp.]|nr:hypothetical protein [Clostridium sp.]
MDIGIDSGKIAGLHDLRHCVHEYTLSQCLQGEVEGKGNQVTFSPGAILTPSSKESVPSPTKTNSLATASPPG